MRCGLLRKKNLRQAALPVQRNPIRSDQTKLKCPWFYEIRCSQVAEHMAGRQKIHIANPEPRVPGILGFGVQTNITPRPGVWDRCQELGLHSPLNMGELELRT